MDKLLLKMRRAVAVRTGSGPAIADVHSATLSFSTYRYVLLVVALVSLYYLFWASDRFVTQAQVYVKSTDASTVALPQVQFLGGQTGDIKDALLVDAFVGSQDMLNILEERVQFSSHFSSGEWDMFSRMSAEPSSESRLSYFQSKLTAAVDPDSGILTLKARAFSPEVSLQMVEEAIRGSEGFINSIGQQIALEEIAFVETEMERAAATLKDVRAKLLQFQNENGLLSAEASGASRQALVDEMESQLVRLRTEEKTLSGYLNEAASELVAVRGRINAMMQQLEIERGKLASQDGVSINDVNAAYQALELELKFATDLYQTTLVSMEKARVESYKKLKHLVVVRSPQLPEEALEPRKLYNIATLFIALSLAYGVIAMIIATIREHRDV